MTSEFEKRILSSIILIPLSFFFILKGSILFNCFLISFYLITSYEWYMMTNKKTYHLPGYLFLIYSFYSVYCLRNNFGDESLFYFLLIVITCISTDTGEYFLEKFLRKINKNQS